MANPILYNYFRSSTSYRARIALHLKGIVFDYKPIALLKDEQHSPEYLKINPQGEVPALIHNGNVISQSLPIMEYIDEVFPGPRIYPMDPVKRAQVRQFCENINSFLHPLGNLKVMKYLEKNHGFDQAAKDAWVQHWFGIGLVALEKILETSAGTYCFGGEVTAADMCLVPALYSARRFNVKIEDYPIITRVEREALKHPAFVKSHPGKQIDTPPDLKN